MSQNKVKTYSVASKFMDEELYLTIHKATNKLHAFKLHQRYILEKRVDQCIYDSPEYHIHKGNLNGEIEYQESPEYPQTFDELNECLDDWELDIKVLEII